MVAAPAGTFVVVGDVTEAGKRRRIEQGGARLHDRVVLVASGEPAQHRLDESWSPRAAAYPTVHEYAVEPL